MATQTTPPFWDDIDDALMYATTLVGASTAAANAAARITVNSQPSLTEVNELFAQVGGEMAHALALLDLSTTVDTSSSAHAYLRGRVARLFGGRVMQTALAARNRDVPKSVSSLIEQESGWIDSIRSDAEFRSQERKALLQLGATLLTADPSAQRDATRRRMVRSNWIERTNTRPYTRPPEQTPDPRPLEPAYGGLGEPE